MMASSNNLAEGNDETENDCSDEEIGLSEETLAALKEFALNIGAVCDLDENNDILSDVRNFLVTEREETFLMKFTSSDNRVIEFSVKGIKKELGQTLSSTGLTIWRAAEHLCDFIFENPRIIYDKSVCELGAGLGLVTILIDKMGTTKSIVATDGDDDTLELLAENVEFNGCKTVEVEKLWWGLHEGFLEMHSEGFDVILAADVIYEEEQVFPLLLTAQALLKGDGIMYLAFARRNVSIDKVFETALEVGLQWNIVETEINNLEPIYLFQKRSSANNNISNIL